METVGYAEISKNATTGRAAVPLERFTGKPCRVLEFASDGSVLIVDAEATGIASFDKCDVRSSFKCAVQGIVICPPNQDALTTMMYAAKATTRKGGYTDLLRRMVIAASLAKGEFTDSFLWQKQ